MLAGIHTAVEFKSPQIPFWYFKFLFSSDWDRYVRTFDTYDKVKKHLIQSNAS